MKLIKRVNWIWDSMGVAFICWRYDDRREFNEQWIKQSIEIRLNLIPKISIDFKITKNK